MAIRYLDKPEQADPLKQFRRVVIDFEPPEGWNKLDRSLLLLRLREVVESAIKKEFDL